MQWFKDLFRIGWDICPACDGKGMVGDNLHAPITQCPICRGKHKVSTTRRWRERKPDVSRKA